jgi:hypothetical protein
MSSKFDQALRAYQHSVKYRITSQAVFYGELLVALDPRSEVAISSLAEALIDQGRQCIIE